MMKQEKFSDDNSILRFLAEKKTRTRKIAPAARDRGRTLPQISICGNEAFP